MYNEVNIYEVIEHLYKEGKPKFAKRVIELMLDAKQTQGRLEAYYSIDNGE